MGYIDKKLIWELTDGTLAITHLHENDMRLGESEDEFITRFIQKLSIRFGVIPSIINSSDIPTDETNRNEWSLIGKKVEVDPVKVQAKTDQIAATEAIISKLGLTKEEYDKLP